MNSTIKKLWHESWIGYNNQSVEEEVLNKFATLIAQHLLQRIEPLYDADSDPIIDDPWDRGYNMGVENSFQYIEEFIKEVNDGQ
jgi:hypothetical protein